MRGFERTMFSSVNSVDKYNTKNTGISGMLSDEERNHLIEIENYWNFYEGYHWQGVEDQEGSQITVNYCRAFVNKFASFELGMGFSMSTSTKMKDEIVTSDGRTLFQFLEDVWIYNNQFKICTDLGILKSITGDAWLQVVYESPEDIDDDPFGEFPNGKTRIIVHNTSTIFPTYNPHDRTKLDEVRIMYEYEDIITTRFLQRQEKVKRVFVQTWTKDSITTDYGNGEEPEVIENRYGLIPFVRIENMTNPIGSHGYSDLEDIIPLNIDYNLRKSDMSEILDYHASPVTVVKGAKIASLEKGPNKVWGGLPKDASVNNLELKGDLSACSDYLENDKLSMCEIAGIPETCLGGAQAISNTSGVALQYINMPLIEKTRLKRQNTENGLERLNKIIILINLLEGVLIKPETYSEEDPETKAVTTKTLTNRDFFYNEVTLPNTLPKDELLELQQIEQELSMSLESRFGAMQRLGKEDITNKLKEIDEDRKEHPEAYMKDGGFMNSGFMNGESGSEMVAKETTGQNGGGEAV